ncbi:hypothetical protein B0H14DRAFT_3865294 [Mycena olivaceomarginata]|nr:hypothetical protein B0H14DRAFT_3865294 [Mycena olivaceomarginata]
MPAVPAIQTAAARLQAWSSPASSLCGAVQLFRQRPTFASKFRKHNNGVLDIIRPQLVLDQAPLLKAFPVPKIDARYLLVETTARSSYFHTPHFPPCMIEFPIYWCTMLTLTHLPSCSSPHSFWLYATHPIAPTTARASPLAERYPPPYQTLALRSTPKHHSSDHHRVAGLGTHALDAARPKSSPDTWATGKTNAVSSYALNAPFQLFGSARWRCTTDNAFSVPVGTLLGVERGDVETLASTVHAANLLRMWG